MAGLWIGHFFCRHGVAFGNHLQFRDIAGTSQTGLLKF
jgi:hypothetical protein